MKIKLNSRERLWPKALKVPHEGVKCLTPTYSSKAVGYSPQDREEKRKDEILVQNLNNWERSVTNSTPPESIKIAKSLLIRRKNHQNQAEETVLSRKSGPISRSNASSPIPKELFKETLKNLKESSQFNKQFEDELQVSYKKYLKNLNDLIKQRENLRNDVSRLREDLKIAHTEIESCKFLMKGLERSKKKLKTNGKAAEYFTGKASLREQMNKKESKCAELGRDIEGKINKNGRLIEKLDTECTKARKELTFFKDALLEHYKNLLKEGKDSRTEGLRWVVKAIWSLGEKVLAADFPSFLDCKIIDSILFLAEYSRDLEELAENSGKSIGKLVFLPTSQEKLSEVHLRLAEASKKIRVKQPKIWVLNERKSVITWNNLSTETENSLSQPSLTSFNFQLKTKELRQKIEQVQEQAIERIFNQCYQNKYESKKHVSLKVLVASLVGFENIEKYNSLIIRLKREANERLSLTRTFKFFSPKSSSNTNFLS